MGNLTSSRPFGLFSAIALAALVTAPASCKRTDQDNAADQDKAAAKDKAQPTIAAKTTDPRAGKTDVAQLPVEGITPSGIAWIHDDYSAALAKAKAENKPLVIDMWAPWCHTCLSMKHYVLVDAGLKSHADRFVWVALDTDKPQNAPALAKYPVTAWPTFFVVSPDETVQARQLGSSSVSVFRELLDQGERGHRAGDKQLAANSPEALLREADRAAVNKDYAVAAAHYQKALAAAPKDWPRTADVLVSQISSLYKAGDKKACAKLGLARIDDTIAAATASTADFSYYANSCAAELPKAKADKLRTASLAAIATVLDKPDAGLAKDDRSDALRMVRELHLAAGDKDSANKAARAQQKLLDEAAASAPDAKAAMTYNWPRSEVYVYLGEGDKLVPELEKSMADLPKEYDPPYRLAWVLHKTGKQDRALEAANKALALAYGPRKGRVMGLIAAIYAGLGDKAAEKKARQQVLEHYKALPEGHKSDGAIKRAQKALDAMDEG